MNMLVAVAALMSIRDCGNGAARATNLTFDSQPVNPIVGDNVSLWVGYTLTDTPITGGTATYSLTLNGLPFPATVDPLCGQTSCPKQIGFNNESSSSTFPSGVSGKIVSAVSWKDQNSSLVWCVETTWKV
jgi:hypothetical protein